MVRSITKVTFITIVSLLIGFVLQPSTEAKIDSQYQDKFETAKMNLVIGETKKAQEIFLELKAQIDPVKGDSDELGDFYTDVLYNLALTYEQKYDDELASDSLEGASEDDLLTANKYFDEADPELLEQVASIQGAHGPETSGPLFTATGGQTRAVGGIVGKIIKGKVKEWLQQKQNCSCTFTSNELNLAGKIFISLTEKTDIPNLKDLKTRDTKIQEIFSRIRKYINSLTASDPTKVLFNNKIQVKCKL